MRHLFFLAIIVSCCILLGNSLPSMKNVEILGNESESKSDSGSNENGNNRNHIRARIGKISDRKKVESSQKGNGGDAKCGYEVFIIFY